MYLIIDCFNLFQMANKDRKHGFYWVKCSNRSKFLFLKEGEYWWEIARYDYDRWSLAGTEDSWNDVDFEEIIEDEIILRPNIK